MSNGKERPGEFQQWAMGSPTMIMKWSACFEYTWPNIPVPTFLSGSQKQRYEPRVACPALTLTSLACNSCSKGSHFCNLVETTALYISTSMASCVSKGLFRFNKTAGTHCWGVGRANRRRRRSNVSFLPVGPSCCSCRQAAAPNGNCQL